MAASTGTPGKTVGIALAEVTAALDAELNTFSIPDYPGAVNGLQFANSGSVGRVAVAVDASKRAVHEARQAGADLLIVHHGLFWGGALPVTGVAYDKYSTLIGSNIAVYSSHLPLDAHPTLGNNTRLAAALGLEPAAGFARYKTVDVGVQGTADISTSELLQRVTAYSSKYGGTVRTSVDIAKRVTRRWAICTGSGASSETIAEAISLGIDTLIVGEGPHHTTVGAIEQDLCIIFAGHYATETLGVQALGEFLESRFGLPWTFLHLPTGS